MPKLWSESIESHRRAVRDAALDAVGALVAAKGVPSVTMSQIAEDAGIGRATLYKYFADVGAVLLAWHERMIGDHLRRLHEVGTRDGTASERLEAVLTAYAFMSHHGQGAAATELLHQGAHVTEAQQQLTGFIRDLVAEGARSGELRQDVAPDELASYCLHALSAAGSLSSPPAVHRLVAVTLDGMRGG